MSANPPSELVHKYRQGIVSREALCDYLYKREAPRSYRLRKRALRGLERWRRRGVRLRRWLPVPRLRDLRDPQTVFVFGRVGTILLLPVVVPIALAAVMAFGVGWTLQAVWRGPLVAFLGRHRQRAHRRLAARIEDELRSPES